MQLSRHRANANDSTNEPRRRGVISRLRRRTAGSPGRAVAFAGVVIAIAVAPVALASGWGGHSAGFNRRSSLRGGIHNPPHSSFSRTTGLFANTKGWVTRMKNLGSGGAATLLCGAPSGGSACLEANNSSSGFAFQFMSAGSTGGTILLKNTAGAPFTTNAHGVATGLNANYLQGKQASEFQLASKPAAKAEDAEKLGGQPASAYVSTSQLLFADVNAEAKIEGARGATAVTKSESGKTFTVAFGESDVSKCSYTASPRGAALEGAQIGVAPTSGNAHAVDVNVPEGFSGGFDLQVVC